MAMAAGPEMPGIAIGKIIRSAPYVGPKTPSLDGKIMRKLIKNCQQCG